MSRPFEAGERLLRTERVISFIRLGVVGFNLVTYLTLGPSGGDRHGLAVTLIVIASVYALAAVMWDTPLTNPAAVPAANMVLDNALIALWLYATGGFSSPYFPLFYAEAAASVGRFGTIIGGASSIGSAVLYVVVVLVDGGGRAYDVLVRVGYIFVIAAFVAYVDEGARKSERETAAAEASAEAYRELSRLQSGFVANVSHELRTPLTTIRGVISTLLRSGPSLAEDEKENLLEMMDSRSAHLAKLIQDVLDLAMQDQGKLTLELTEFDLRELVADEVSEVVRSTGRNIELEPTSGSLVVVADRPKLARALHNVLDNATKFSPAGTSISVTVLEGDDARIEVVDQGVGMGDEQKDRIFERFYQVDSSLTRSFEGTGIGLAVTEALVMLHGGRVEVDSSPGQGSKFVLVIPREARAPRLRGSLSA